MKDRLTKIHTTAEIRRNSVENSSEEDLVKTSNLKQNKLIDTKNLQESRSREFISLQSNLQGFEKTGDDDYLDIYDATKNSKQSDSAEPT